jgi:Zn-dependent peptidase ImmA (M78 family)
VSDYIASPLSRKAISEFASIVRGAFNLADEKYFPVVEFLEHAMPKLDKQFCYEYSDIAELGNREGLTIPSQHKILIREDVYNRACEGSHRDRFTIAHEIGHYLMHGPDRIALARSNQADNIPAYKRPEWQANTFAGEILAPASVIQGMTVPEIVHHCGVSRKVAEIQRRFMR